MIGPLKFPSKYIPIDKKFKHLLWCPNIVLYNQQKIKSHYFIGGGITETNWLSDDNIVALDFKFNTFITCKMRFESYPFDYHVCYLRLSSWSYNDASLHIEMT